jgi:ribonuclease-3 family protein
MERYLKGLSDKNSKADHRTLSPLVLAYIGDACYELYIRNRVLIENYRLPPEKLHRLTVGYVRASSQSDIIHGIWEELEKDEQAVVRRGRNAKSGTSPKNADITQYRYATGFETLLGYLFIKGDIQRLIYILDKSYGSFTDNG